MKTLSAGVAVIFAVWASIAQAQVVVDQAATAGESYARGISGIIQSQGQRNLDNSQAAINMEDARSANIDNNLKSVNAYWQEKEIYNEHLQQQNAVIDQRRTEYLAKHGLQPLSSSDFDRTTGHVNWPKILEQPQYDDYRKTIDQLFQERSYNGALSGEQYVQATAAFKDWHSLIVSQKDEYPAPIVSQMLRFILKLKREMDDNLS